MSISEVSIKNPVFAWMLMAALILFGALGYQRMGISQLPDVDYPVVSISLSLPGAAPEVMELDVVDQIEEALTTIQGVKGIASSSKMGRANITIDFELDKDINLAVQEIQNVISSMLRDLPKDMNPPEVHKTNPEDQPILWLTVSSKTLAQKEVMTMVRDRIKDYFTTIDGVGEVSLGGYVDPNLRVWVSSKELNQHELTVSDVINTISAEHSELPSGRIEMTDRELNIRTLGEATSVEQFANITINRRGGGPNYNPIKLKEIANIEDGLADVRRISRVMGASAVGLGITKQRGANAVSVAKAVKNKIKEIIPLLPKDVELGIRFDSSTFIEDSINELNFTLILSAILTAIACWLFLGSWSATLNIIMAIPTSVVGSFIVLYFLGFTLNTFTLLGLSLAIGIVVDDAIMVLENIVRHMENGKNRRMAALLGSKEITMAAMAATAAIVAIFLPVAFMEGIIGKFFFQFGVTLTIAVLLSLLEALTLTPMRCSEFLEVKPRKTFIGKLIDTSFKKSAENYRSIVRFVLRHRVTTIIIALIFFIGTYGLAFFLKKEFVPAQDQGRLMLRIQTAPGSSLSFTERKTNLVEKVLADYQPVDQYFSNIGGGGGGGGDVNAAMIFITLKPIKERDGHVSQVTVASELRKRFKELKGMKVVIQDPSLSGFSTKRGLPVEFSIRGPDWDGLVESSQKMMDAMTASGIMTDVDSDYRTGMPELQVIPNREKARMYGVSINDIGQTINVMMGGVIAGKYSKGGHRYDIGVRLLGGERDNPEDIKKLNVRNNRGELIPISDLVTLKEVKSLQAISRQNRERAITVFANVAPHSSQAKAIEYVNDLALKTLPSGYHAVVSGSAQTFQESFSGLIFALILGIIVAYMVLASQFNSFIHPFTVLVALPFSISGAFIALLIGQQSLNIYSMIGLILLMGIVKKNSILLVDFTNQMRKKGLGVEEALVEACPIRLRPILMTSFATIAAAIPPALAVGPGAETRMPMALAVIGGVFVSTGLTLFVVPCVYSLLAKLERKKGVSTLAGD